MPRSSLVGAKAPSRFDWSQSLRYQAEEGRALSALLGLSTTPLTLPMLWLGKSALPQTMRELAVGTYFAVQEAQEFFYKRPLRENEQLELQITLHHETSDAMQRLLVTARINTDDATDTVTLKSTIRLIEKPSEPQAAAITAAKPRASTAPDHILHIIDQDLINRYAALSGDNNPVHLDRAFAQSLGLPDTVAHGMILLGLTQQAFSLLSDEKLAEAFPLHLSCRFLLPVHAGQQTGLAVKQSRQDERLSERVTLSSAAGPHALAQIHYRTTEER